MSMIRHGIWMMESQSARAWDAEVGAFLASMRAGMAPLDKIDAAFAGKPTIVAEIAADGTAELDLYGAWIPRAPVFIKAFRPVIDPHDVAAVLDGLTADSSVQRLVINLDSSGGQTAGMDAAIAAMSRFQAAGKNVEVRTCGLLASAAYWFAAGADRIVASPSSVIGSLGTCCILQDDTAAEAAAGIKSIFVASTPTKAAMAGGPLSAEGLTATQARVNAVNSVLRDAVAAGRGLAGDALEAVMTGGVWLAEEARALGLIDAVATGPESVDPPTSASVPIAPIVIDEEQQSTAAAAANTESPMDAKTLAALAAQHPTHAALILAEAAKDGATEATVRAAIAAAETKASADEIAKLKADLATATEAKAKAEADLAKLKAHAAPADPGQGDPTVAEIPVEKAGSLTVAQLDAIKAGKAKLVG